MSDCPACGRTTELVRPINVPRRCRCGYIWIPMFWAPEWRAEWAREFDRIVGPVLRGVGAVV